MNPGTLDPFTIAQMERATGIEPASPAWKAGALPLSYARMLQTGESLCLHAAQRIYMSLIYWVVCRSASPAAGQKNGVSMPSDDRRGCMNMKLWDSFCPASASFRSCRMELQQTK